MTLDLASKSLRPAILIAAIGCIAGLLIWPGTAGLRFLTVLLWIVVPVVLYLAIPMYRAIPRLMRTRKRRWTQFSLASALSLMLLCGLGLKWVEPYYSQKELIAEVLARNGQVYTKPMLPDWMPRRFLGIDLRKQFTMVDVVVLVNASDADLEHLAKLRGAKLIPKLRLDNAQVTDSGLAQLPRFTSCEGFAISGNRITDEGLHHLRQMKTCSFIALSGCGISDKALLHLAQLPACTEVWLDGHSFTDEGLISLAQMPNLKVLNLKGTRVTHEGIDRFDQRIGRFGVRVNYDYQLRITGIKRSYGRL